MFDLMFFFYPQAPYKKNGVFLFTSELPLVPNGSYWNANITRNTIHFKEDNRSMSDLCLVCALCTKNIQ